MMDSSSGETNTLEIVNPGVYILDNYPPFKEMEK